MKHATSYIASSFTRGYWMAQVQQVQAGEFDPQWLLGEMFDVNLEGHMNDQIYSELCEIVGEYL